MTTLVLSTASRLELSGLVHRYAGYVDARRFDEVAELFTANAELVLPDPPDHLEPCVRHHGHAGVRDAMSALTAVTRTQHGIVGEIYASATPGDVATGEITGVAHHWIQHDGKLTDHVWYLRYRDTYHRVEQGWRIAQRALTIDAIESRPARQVRS
ncbi:nuclear transport factor 2 family protein [[Mycobacterium] holstebronense]|uniref:Nuclear transport factor 2 family protein n=1 Tax=[Mycobacterium] holstebronense TaxID=3064288 RepID=A0ABM9M3Z8_9MYCO|nr:nuclear transport factor 2 family protein [Mycolicibacter sp. MU0102]CAJ1509859.1 nuclear transport factor 2 family protein [Mycolicibacter sp. MU0102]